MSVEPAPLSRRAVALQIFLLSLFLLAGASILFSAMSRLFAESWPILGAAKVSLLGAGLLLFGAAGLRGAFLSEGHHRPSLLAKAYYHSRFGHWACHVAAACVFGWLALRVLQAL